MSRQQASGVTVRPWVLSLLAIVVTLVWAVNILAALFVPTYQADGGVNAVMGALLALIGAIGGKSLLSRPHQGTAEDTAAPPVLEKGPPGEP